MAIGHLFHLCLQKRQNLLFISWLGLSAFIQRNSFAVTSSLSSINVGSMQMVFQISFVLDYIPKGTPWGRPLLSSRRFSLGALTFSSLRSSTSAVYVLEVVLCRLLNSDLRPRLYFNLFVCFLFLMEFFRFVNFNLPKYLNEIENKLIRSSTIVSSLKSRGKQALWQGHYINKSWGTTILASSFQTTSTSTHKIITRSENI